MNKNCQDILSVKQNHLFTSLKSSTNILSAISHLKKNLVFYCLALFTLINTILRNTSLRYCIQ